MGKMSQKFMLRLTLRQQSYKIKKRNRLRYIVEEECC